MRDELIRLRRILGAQRALVQLLEVRLGSEQRRLLNLQRERSELIAAVDRISLDVLPYSAGICRLARLEAEIASAQEKGDSLRKALIKAKATDDVLSRRHESVAYGVARKESDEETREVALSMPKTASHKTPMLE